MIRMVICILFSLLTATGAYATGFSPTLLKLEAPPVIEYNFDGSELPINVSVTGANAETVFCVFTKDRAHSIEDVTNGFLGWHYVNKTDTCVYASPSMKLLTGNTTIVWDGRNSDGEFVDAGTYTYYLWGFDSYSSKTKVCSFIRPDYSGVDILERDGDGLPMTSPILFTSNLRWRVGSDPYDESAIQTSTLTVKSGYRIQKTACLDPNNPSYMYTMMENTSTYDALLAKFRWVPGGNSELITDFGDGGYSDTFSIYSGDEPGVVADGEYLYTGTCSYTADGYTDSDFIIFDTDGDMVDYIDISEWWSSTQSYDANGQANGGPNSYSVRNNKVFLNCHCSCIKQMVDPIRYLNGDSDGFYVWTNGNGDYVFDKNFENSLVKRWVCNDVNASPSPYTLDADDNLFSVGPANGGGMVSFGLMAPDGTGLGYFSFNDELSGSKLGTLFIDSGTPYDGLYCDNESGYLTSGTAYGTWFIAHDSISGTITAAPNSVETADNEAPGAFSLSQNTPNPFNPSTSIPFTLNAESRVSLDVYNVAGAKVATLADGVMAAGAHEIAWDATGQASGMYFCRLKAAGTERTIKMTLVK